MPLSDKLKACRKELGISQTELGQRVGLGIQSICRYEKGERVPNVVTLEKLAMALEKPVSYFTEEVSEKETAVNKEIAVMAIKAQSNPELAEIIKKLNGMTIKQFHLTSIFVKALTDDLED